MKTDSFLKILAVSLLSSLTVMAQDYPNPEWAPDFKVITVDDPAKISGHTSRPIPNQYIVLLNPIQGIKTALEVFATESITTEDEQIQRGLKLQREAQNSITAIAKKLGIASSSILGFYSGVNLGFFATIPDAVAQRLMANIKQFPEVNSITQDQTVARTGELTKSNVPFLIKKSQSIPWGIVWTGWGNYTGNRKAWILDTGIDLMHADLNVVSTSPLAMSFIPSETVQDGHGHGTHVAGTIAAKNNTFGVVGVAAGARVVPVKVLSNSGFGSWGGVLSGVNHVATYGVSGDVVNMSLGGAGSYPILENAITTLASKKKIFFSLAAGNNNINANNFTPARANGINVYTISATDIKCNITSFSNFGNPPVDFAAPGLNIHSTYKGNAYATMSGTSMAAPHVAGILLMNNGIILVGGCCGGALCTDKDPVKDRVAKK